MSSMDSVYISLITYAGFILFFNLISHLIKETIYISETLFACLFGILSKKFASIDVSDDIIVFISRVLMSIQVVAVGMNVSKRYIIKEKQSLLMLLFPVMILTFIFSGITIYMLSDMDIRIAFIVGAAITPTDPVLASAILKGNFANKYIPQHLRNLLMVESGVNDGLGFPLLMLPILLLKYKNVGMMVSDFLLHIVLYEVGLGVVIGSTIGIIARKMLLYCKNRGYVDKESYLSYLLVLSFFSIGVTALIKVDDILALFFVGLFFSWDECLVHHIRESHLLEIVDLIFSLNYFIFLGSLIDFSLITKKMVLLAVLLIVLKRLPFVMLFDRWIPQLFSKKEVFFAGWYGPVGVGAVFFGYLALEHLQKIVISNKAREKDLKNLDVINIKGIDDIIPTIYMIVFTSIIIHGVTAPIVHFHLRRKRERTEEVYQAKDESDYTEGSGENTELDALL